MSKVFFAQFAEADSVRSICNLKELTPIQKVNNCKYFFIKLANKDNYKDAFKLYSIVNSKLSGYGNNYVYPYSQYLLGIVATESSLYDSSKVHLQRAIGGFEAIGNDTMLCSTKNVLGFTYYTMGNYEIAIENFINAIEIAEKTKNLKLLASSFSYAGLSFFEKPNPDYEKALFYYLKSYEASVKNKKTTSLLLMRIGSSYSKLKNYNKAESILKRALFVSDSMNDNIGKRWSLFGLGKHYFDINDINKAIGNFNQAQICFKKDFDIPGLIKGYQYIANCYFLNNQTHKALSNIDSAIYYSLKYKINQTLADIYLLKSNILQNSEKSTEALFFYKMYVQTKDSLFNIQNNNNLNELEAKYSSHQKEKEIIFLNQQKKADTQFKKILMFAFLISIILIFVALYAVYKINNAKKILNQKNIEIERQKHIVEEKALELANQQKEIIDSIHYAKRIQQSLLPTEKYINRNLKKNKN
ncbi:MAG: tetratricopeptide repeat protein [Bacteroidota bacterium]|nr:tetratricopeptide repeat protein [Bacteroidota bacterium]